MSKLSNKDLKKILNKYIKEQQRYTRAVFGSSQPQIDKIFKEHQEVIERIYRDLISGKVNQSLPFRYADYPHLATHFASIQASLQTQLYDYTVSEIATAWNKSNRDIDAIVKAVFPNATSEKLTKYLNHNESAQKAFINRNIASGRTLKGRTWLLSNNYLRDVEDTLSIGILNGDSAEVLGKRINKYLNNHQAKVDDISKITDKPTKSLLEQRLIDEQNKTSKTISTSKYHAKMLARNEINLAYRNAETERINRLDFIVGYEIKLSNAHPMVDICDYVAGKYPKDFVWNSWHPQCLCYRVMILKTVEELDKENEIILRGGELTNDSVNKVNDIPSNAKDYFQENYERFSKYKNKPYFMEENNLPSILGKERMSNVKYVSQVKDQSSYVDKLSKEIASKYNVQVTDINLKSNNRIFEKATSDYNGNISKVQDIVRNTFIVPEGKHEEVLNAIRSSFDVSRIKVQSLASDPLGYSGTILNIKLPKGGFAEIQLNSASMIYGKDGFSKDILKTNLFDKIARKSGLESGLGHQYYEEWRTLNKSIPTQYKRMQELERLSNSYYNKLRKLDL